MATEKASPLHTMPESLPREENSSAPEWMLIRTHPGKERLVATLLQTRAETFIPCDKRLSQDKRMISVVPNYVFVRVNENAPMAWIKTISGVNYVLPTRIPNSDIEEIKNGPNHTVDVLAILEAAKKQNTNLRPLRPA